MAVAALSRPHGLDYSGPTRWAIYIVLGIGAFLTGVLAVAELGSFADLKDNSVISIILAEIAFLTLPAGHIAAIVGLAKGREWGRLAGTYAAGFWFSTGIFMPVALGLVWVFYHPHLPGARDAAGHVVAAARTPHADSPAAHPEPADGIPTVIRWVVVALMGLTTLVLAFMLAITLAVQNVTGPAFAIVAFIYLSLLVAAITLGIVGIGRGLPWGRAAVTFACAVPVLSVYFWPPMALVLALLYWPRARTQVAATAPTG